MDKFEKKPITGGSDFFRSLAKTPQYKRIEQLIQKSLEEQWNDLIISGVIKTLYAEYPKYFVNRRGVKIKLKKSFKKQDEDDIRSEEELRALATENLQEDKISVTSSALKMGALLGFMATQVGQRSKSISSYNKFRPEMNGYLKNMANKGGQSIIDSIKIPQPIKFRLSKKDLVSQISSRTNTLIKGLDKTTKKRFVNQLAIGIKKGERKSAMIKRMQGAGLRFSEERARKIVMTETVAVSEWMRQQTAMMNGATHKIWETAEDERVCPICEPLNGGTIGIESSFHAEIEATDTVRGSDFTGMAPPAHALCRCTVRYEFKECGDFVKHHTSIFDRVTELFNKAKNNGPDYEIEGKSEKCQNPEAVWAGGESLVGQDKVIGNYYDEIRRLEGTDRKIALEYAQLRLSDEGYVQLRLKLGLKGRVTPLPYSLEERKKFYNTYVQPNVPVSGTTTWGSVSTQAYETELRISQLQGYGKLGVNLDEIKALKQYVGNINSWEINKALRAGVLSSDQKLLTKYIDNTLLKLESQPLPVFRGIRLSAQEGEKFIKNLESLGSFKDTAYFSTSYSKNWAQSFIDTRGVDRDNMSILFKIESPKGGKDIVFGGESEVIFPRNTNFLVKSIATEENGVRIIGLKEAVQKAVSKELKEVYQVLNTADKELWTEQRLITNIF